MAVTVPCEPFLTRQFSFYRATESIAQARHPVVALQKTPDFVDQPCFHAASLQSKHSFQYELSTYCPSMKSASAE